MEHLFRNLKEIKMNIIHKVPLIVEPLMDNAADILSGQMRCKGIVTCEHFRKGELIHEQTGFNTFTTEGMAKICNIIFGTTAKTGAIGTFVGLFKNNIVPAVGDTAAKLGSGNAYGECQDADYTPATSKPNYTIAATTTAGCTNAASKAEFTMAAAITVYGAFISMVAAKTDTVGPLICAKKFTTARATEIGDVLAISYVISLTTS
jgi:hypothetical protein